MFWTRSHYLNTESQLFFCWLRLVIHLYLKATMECQQKEITGLWVFTVFDTISTKNVLYKKCRACRGSIYREIRRGPKTDPCGTPLWNESTVLRFSHLIRVFNLVVHFCKLIILFHTRILFRAGWESGTNHAFLTVSSTHLNTLDTIILCSSKEEPWILSTKIIVA